eukprot:COSAG01_NODE_9914_length_2301_cov_5.022696_3_plen_64_part_01
MWCLHWGVVVAWAVSKFWLEGGGLPAAGEWSGCCRVPWAIAMKTAREAGEFLDVTLVADGREIE